jgi:hypothetical protein
MEYIPVEQRTQSELLMAPLVLPNLPATQALHASTAVVLAGLSFHLPKVQSLHCFFCVRPVAALYVPAGHGKQSGGFVASVVEPYVPARHAADVHAGWPVWSVYSDPALQPKHDVMSMAPLVLPNLPASQGVHSVLAVFPASPSHLPGMHLLHAADSDAPIAELNLPRSHGLHDLMAICAVSVP